jgi:phosphatidate cytidylyltransferase
MPRERSETGPRVLAALPAIAFAIAIVALGGGWFVAGLIGMGVLAMHELYSMMRRARPIDLAGFLSLAGLLVAAWLGGRDAMLACLVATIPVTFFLALARPGRENVAWGIAATTFGIVWIGVALGHAVLLRELAHGGALVADVAIGTFVGDTCAYFGGRAWGRRPLAPGISPNKTLEGLIAGVVGGTLAFWGFAVAYQDWFDGGDVLLIGFFVALASPLGDLFESLIKRDLQAKDTGRFFGAHGGVLDRLDGVLFSAVVGYYASVAVL